MAPLAGPSPALVAELLLVGVAAVWGGTFPVIKTLVGQVPPHTLLALRFTAAAALLLVPAWPRRVRLKAGGRRALVRDGMLLGLSLWAAYFLQTAGLQFTTASKAAFLTALGVVLVPLLGYLFFQRRPAPATWAGVGVATVGLASLSLPGGGGWLPASGDLLVLLAAVAFALQVLLVDRWGPRHDPLLLTGVELGTVALFSLPAAIALEELPLHHPPSLWAGLVYLAVPATAIALWIQIRYQHQTDPTRVGIILSMEPVFGALLAWLFLGERMAPSGLAGGALVLAGLLLTEIGGRRPPGTAPAGGQGRAPARAPARRAPLGGPARLARGRSKER